MIGIYKFTNLINGKSYVGQSVNLENRKRSHLSSSKSPKASDCNVNFHKALREFGEENFSYEILEEIPSEEYSSFLLDELEIYYIKKYNTLKEGYNMTPGGSCIAPGERASEKNGRSLLTKEDVEYIRECYNNHIPFKQVYEKFKNLILKRGLQKVWWFDTWKDIHPEYHSLENRHWHSHEAKANNSKVASQNQRKFSREEVLNMREDYDNGMTPKQVWKKYSPNGDVVWSTIYNIITRVTYKDIK